MALEHRQLRKRGTTPAGRAICRVYLRDHHAGYITWEQFEEHLQTLRGNNVKGDRDESVGPGRAGGRLVLSDLTVPTRALDVQEFYPAGSDYGGVAQGYWPRPGRV